MVLGALGRSVHGIPVHDAGTIAFSDSVPHKALTRKRDLGYRDLKLIVAHLTSPQCNFFDSLGARQSYWDSGMALPLNP
jgi:hypothetical protein